MKKLAALLIILSLSVFTIGCGGDDSGTNGDDSSGGETTEPSGDDTSS